MKNFKPASSRIMMFVVSTGVIGVITLGAPTISQAMGIQLPVAAQPTSPTDAAPVIVPTPSPVAVHPAPTPAAPVVAPQPTTSASSTSFKALWIGRNSDAPNWTLYAEEALQAHGPNLLRGPSDIESFCPMYSRLGHQDQLNVWVQLLAGVVDFESGFNPVSYMTEATMGNDPITGSQVISAGLFQLSYQDTPNYKSHVAPDVCIFDYPSDRKLAMTDIHRTINDPKNNITCAVSIMNYLVGRHGAIAYDSGNYWSTLMPSSRYGKVPQIKAITRALPFCKN